jgi:hypothetical protein
VAESGTPEMVQPINVESPPESATSAASNKTLVEPYSGDQVDTQFIDNLVAADRFKTFLVGRGVEVPFGVSRGISELVSAFASDIAKARGDVEIQLLKSPIPTDQPTRTTRS